MTEIALREDDHLPALPVQPAARPTANPAADMLVSWARGAQAADYLAGPVSETKFAGAFRGDKDGSTAAILYGAEVGLSPIQALQSVHVVKDRPGFYARTMQAIVQAAGHEVWTETSSASRVVVCGRRRGSRHVERAEWTMQRATNAGYVAQNANYRKDPESMLWARAMSECCRRLAPDALAGLVYSIEELQDEDTGGSPQPASRTATASEQEPVKRTARRRQSAEAPTPPEPDLDPPPAAEPESPKVEAPSEPGITKAQSAKMHALLNGQGIREREARLSLVRDFTGREVESSADLTKAEAHALIDHLEQMEKPSNSEEPATWPEPAKPADHEIADPADFGGES